MRIATTFAWTFMAGLTITWPAFAGEPAAEAQAG